MLAVRIRNVKIKVVNDSKEIVVIVYFSTIAIVESFLLELVFQEYNTISEALSIGHVLLAASVGVGLIFIPKVSSTYIICTCILSQMISLWRDPHGEKVFTIEDTEKAPFTMLGDKTKIAQLEQEIMSLKQLKSPSLNSSSDVSKNHFKCQ